MPWVAWLAGCLGMGGLLLWAARRWRQPRACPSCGLAGDPARWPRQNRRRHFHGRYTISPVPVCPRCGLELDA